MTAFTAAGGVMRNGMVDYKCKERRALDMGYVGYCRRDIKATFSRRKTVKKRGNESY